MNKQCSKCEELKQLDQFYPRKNSKDGKDGRCKKCCRKKVKEYLRTENGKILKQKQLEKYKKTEKYKKSKRKEQFKRRYNISLDEYEKMFQEQNECCKICNRHQNTLEISLAVDHDHKTNKIRGLLCSSCNKALGFLKDDISILEKAIKYLKS